MAAVGPIAAVERPSSVEAAAEAVRTRSGGLSRARISQQVCGKRARELDHVLAKDDRQERHAEVARGCFSRDCESGETRDASPGGRPLRQRLVLALRPDLAVREEANRDYKRDDKHARKAPRRQCNSVETGDRPHHCDWEAAPEHDPGPPLRDVRVVT